MIARQQALEEAREKFLNRLLKNPALGLSPEEYRLLPGFLKRHTQNIAWSIQRAKQRANRRASGADILLATRMDSSQGDAEIADVLAALQQFIETQLPEEEAWVFRFRRYCGWTISQIAAATGLSESKVKTRLKRAQGAIERWLKAHS